MLNAYFAKVKVKNEWQYKLIISYIKNKLKKTEGKGKTKIRCIHIKDEIESTGEQDSDQHLVSYHLKLPLSILFALWNEKKQNSWEQGAWKKTKFFPLIILEV